MDELNHNNNKPSITPYEHPYSILEDKENNRAAPVLNTPKVLLANKATVLETNGSIDLLKSYDHNLSTEMFKSDLNLNKQSNLNVNIQQAPHKTSSIAFNSIGQPIHPGLKPVGQKNLPSYAQITNQANVPVKPQPQPNNQQIKSALLFNNNQNRPNYLKYDNNWLGSPVAQTNNHYLYEQKRIASLSPCNMNSAYHKNLPSYNMYANMSGHSVLQPKNANVYSAYDSQRNLNSRPIGFYNANSNQLQPQQQQVSYYAAPTSQVCKVSFQQNKSKSFDAGFLNDPSGLNVNSKLISFVNNN